MDESKCEYIYTDENTINLIKRKCEETGLTQAEVEEMALLPEKSLSKIMMGKRYIKTDELGRLGNVLKFDIREVYGVDENSERRIKDAANDIRMSEKTVEEFRNEEENRWINKGIDAAMSDERILGAMKGLTHVCLEFLYDENGPREIHSFEEYEKAISKYPNSEKRMRIAKLLIWFFDKFIGNGKKRV